MGRGIVLTSSSISALGSAAGAPLGERSKATSSVHLSGRGWRRWSSEARSAPHQVAQCLEVRLGFLQVGQMAAVFVHDQLGIRTRMAAAPCRCSLTVAPTPP